MTALDALARDAMATRLFHPPLTLEKLGNKLNRVKIVNATTGLDTGARIFKDAEGWGIARWSHPVTMIDEGCTQARTDGSNRYPTRLDAVKAIVTRFGLDRRTEPLVRRIGGTEVKDVHSW